MRLFVDEVGHHNTMSSDDDSNERYLALTGVSMDIEYERGELSEALTAIKQFVFERSDFSLHRRDLINKHPAPFDVLRDRRKQRQFDDLILQWIRDSEYSAITVLIDKKEHIERYVVWRFQPYHYCMTVMMERYVQWLARNSLNGDVMFESRGEKENRQLAASYKRLYATGTDNVSARLFQKVLTSRDVKIKPKSANIAGLQLADLIANPAYRYLICAKTKCEMTAPFGRTVAEVLYERKYLRKPFDGKVVGWGTKTLP